MIFAGTDSLTADKTVYAKWNVATYTVTYQRNYAGGGIYTSQNGILAGYTLVKPADPGRMGWIFIGLYENVACMILWDFNSDAVRAEAAAILERLIEKIM